MNGSAALHRSTVPEGLIEDLLPVSPKTDAEQLAGAPVIRFHENFEAVEKIWRALEASGSGAVYQRYDWCKVWFETFQTILDARPLIVVVHMAGRPAMLLPLYTFPSTFGLRVAAFIGDKHANIRVPLMTSDAAPRDYLVTMGQNGTLLETLAAELRRGRHADFVNLGCMPASFGGSTNPLFPVDGPLCPDLAFIGPLQYNFDALCDLRRGGVYRKKLRKKSRALEEFGPLRFEHAASKEAVQQALDVFFAQKAARLNTIKLDNAFNLADNRDFVRALARKSQADGSSLLDIYTLKAGAETVAVFAGGRFNGSFSGAINSITVDEPAVSRSPGEVLMHHLIEHLCTQGQTSFDLGLGGAQYKEAWCDPVELRDVTFSVTSAGRLLSVIDKVKHDVRALLLAHPRSAQAARNAKFYIKRAITRL